MTTPPPGQVTAGRIAMPGAEMVTSVGAPSGDGTRLIVCPYEPVSWPAAVVLFLAVSAPIIGVAATCWLLGAWEVMPLSLLVVAAVGTGLVLGHRHTQRVDVISIAGNTVAIDTGDRRLAKHYEFPRGVVQVVLEESAPPRTELSHLYIRSRGSDVEIGSFLDNEERTQLAAQLRRVMDRCSSFESVATG
jgi:uncharacterized membrane protein